MGASGRTDTAVIEVVYPDRVTRRTQRLIVIVLAVLLILPVGAVGLGQLLGPRSGDDEVQDTRAAVDPSDQPSRPQVQAPEEPAAMHEQTAEGAEATATYLLDSYEYMMASGDASPWAENIAPDCETCASMVNLVEMLDTQGGYLVDGGFTVDSTSFMGDAEPPTTGSVTADFTQAEGTLVDDPTKEPVSVPAGSGQVVMTLSWSDGSWTVTDFSDGSGGASDAGGAGGMGGTGGVG